MAIVLGFLSSYSLNINLLFWLGAIGWAVPLSVGVNFASAFKFWPYWACHSWDLDLDDFGWPNLESKSLLSVLGSWVLPKVNFLCEP